MFRRFSIAPYCLLESARGYGLIVISNGHMSKWSWTSQVRCYLPDDLPCRFRRGFRWDMYNFKTHTYIYIYIRCIYVLLPQVASMCKWCYMLFQATCPDVQWESTSRPTVYIHHRAFFFWNDCPYYTGWDQNIYRYKPHQRQIWYKLYLRNNHVCSAPAKATPQYIVDV